MTPTTGTLSIDARWVCVDCGSENIEEHGTVLEVTPLAGAIETDPEMGGPVASPMLEGEIIYDSYNPTGYACRECGRSEEALGALVKLWQPAPEGWPGS